ncbi:MAG: hypothetical protein HYX40_01350 [Sphingobacteriales bacterium]|nr:hypothetical protein [Sphingobacteriales bacterium]
MLSKFTLLSCFSIFFLSCSSYYPYSGFEQTSSITDIPVKPVTTKPDLYFNSERPTVPFFKIRFVEVFGNAGSSYNQMLGLLKQKASGEGMDGIILMDVKQEISYRDVSETVYLKDTSTSITRQVASPYVRMAGIGLKYAANINYLDTIIKKQTIKIYKEEKTKVVTINLDWYGNILNKIQSPEFKDYYDEILPFDIVHAFRAKGNGWSVHSEPFTQKILAKKFSISDFDFIEYKFDYDLYARPAQAKIWLNSNFPRYSPGTVYLFFDNKGYLIEKKLVKKKTVVWRERFVYDEKDRCIKIIRTTGNAERVLMTIENEFFSKKDLPAPER